VQHCGFEFLLYVRKFRENIGDNKKFLKELKQWCAKIPIQKYTAEIFVYADGL
jgi:hypothetical protein